MKADHWEDKHQPPDRLNEQYWTEQTLLEDMAARCKIKYAVGESISDAMDRLHHEKHAKFRQWQDARVMNMIFGDNYVTVPPIPRGYETYAKWWYDNELKAFR